MFGDVFKFLAIWAVVLIGFSSVASLLFGELDGYEHIDVDSVLSPEESTE